MFLVDPFLRVCEHKKICSQISADPLQVPRETKITEIFWDPHKSWNQYFLMNEARGTNAEYCFPNFENLQLSNHYLRKYSFLDTEVVGI